jgi:hypothetical protein
MEGAMALISMLMLEAEGRRASGIEQVMAGTGTDGDRSSEAHGVATTPNFSS